MGEFSQADQAKTYHRIKRYFGYFEFVLTVLFLLALLGFGWTFGIRDWASAAGHPVLRVLVYFLICLVIYEIITFPLNVFSGHVLEKRFGLSNQSFKAWLADLFKAQMVSLILGAVAVEVLYFFFRWAESWWWLPAGGVFTLLFVLLAQLTPVAILPLFFKFKELPDSELTERLKSMADKTGAPVKGIFEWGLESKTRRANAAVVGWGRTRRVILSDSLLKNFTPSEVEVVLAHELGHHRLRHISKLMILQTVFTFAAFFIVDLIFRAAGPYFGLSELADIASLPLVGLAFMVSSLIFMPLANGYSRRLEKEADRYSLELTGLTGSFIAAMERLASLNLAEVEPHPLVEFLFHSHPSISRRIRAAREFSRSSGEST